MKKKKIWSRLFASSVTTAVMIQALPFVPLGQVYAAEQAAEEALKAELAAYAVDFPEGAVSFYEAAGSVKEGDSDREIIVVRLGDSSEEMNVEVKAYDVTAQYGQDYTLYTKVKTNKTFADDSNVTAPKVQTAMENGEFQDMLTQNPSDNETDEETLAPVVGEPVAPAEEETLTEEESLTEQETQETENDAEYETISAVIPTETQEETSETSETDETSETIDDTDSLRDAFRQQTGKQTVNTNWRGEYQQEQAEEIAKQADNEVVNSFDGASLMLYFAPGEYKKSIYLHVEDDDKSEGAENTALILGNASSGLIGNNMQYNVTIEDNEADEALVFAMKDAEIITDRSATYAEVTIERTSGLNYYANLTYRTASGTAESNQAYVPVDAGSVNFAAGQKEAKVRIELTEEAQIGTYFTVLIDEKKNNAEENRTQTKVWIGSKTPNTEDILANSPTSPKPKEDSGSKPHQVNPMDAPLAKGSSVWTETYNGVTYQVAELSSSDFGKWGTSYDFYDGYLDEAEYVKINVTGENGTAFNVYSGDSYIDWYAEYGTGYRMINIGKYRNTHFKIETWTPFSKLKVNSIQLYFPNYTVVSAKENQTLTGKNYTSKNPMRYTPFNVPAIRDWKNSYAGETVVVNRYDRNKYMQNFSSRLEQGIFVSSYDVYAGAAQDNTYISDIKVVGADDWDDAYGLVQKYTSEGWNWINHDLNRNAGGMFIYLLYKTSPNYSDSIKDFVVRLGSSSNSDSFSYNGRTYYLASYDGDKEFTKYKGDLNENAGGRDLYLYYTKQGGSGYGVTGISFNSSSSGCVTDTDGDAVDLNKGAGGDDIFMHTSTALSKYIGTISTDRIEVWPLKKLNTSAATDQALRNANFKLYVTPRYTVNLSTVTFQAEDTSAVSFNGDKGEEGFKAGDTLNLTQIDKVTLTAVDTTDGQKVYPSNIRQTSYGSSTLLYPQNQTGKARLSNTVDINSGKVDFLAMYTRPSLTFQYNPNELGSQTQDFGAITVAPYDKPNQILGTSDYKTPLTIRSDDLSLLRNSYLSNALIGEGKDFYDAEVTINGKKTTIPARTAVVWGYTNPKTGLATTVKGNSFVFSPYYGYDNLTYFFQMEQKNINPVGVNGTVYTLEEPLFYGSAQGQTLKAPAVGVNLLVGGYDAQTTADGSYYVGSYFNKGDMVAAYAKYGTLTSVTTFGTSDNTKHDITINVSDSDALKVVSSKMEKDQLISKATLGSQKTYRRQDAEAMTLEDTKYYLTINAKGQAGVTPKEAEFRVYSKSGSLKSQFTKRIAFSNNTLTYELNPMSMGGAGSLEVGDTFTVTMYDTQGVAYYEHHTGIVVAEAMTGMYLFNYDSWEKEDDSLFVQAMGNLSIAYDFGLDILNSDGLEYRDAEHKLHHFCSIGFGAGSGNGESVYKNEQATMKMLDDMAAGTYTPQPQDALSFFGGASKGTADDFKPTGSSSWNLNIQLGMILDCILDEEKGTMQGKYYFSDFLIVATATMDMEHQWTIPVKGVEITITLHFNVGSLPDGYGSGIRWHFFADPANEERKYLTDNSTIQVLEWKGVKSHGDIGFDASIRATVDVTVAKVFTVGGGLRVEVQNNVIYGIKEKDNPNSTVSGWRDIGAVFLSPEVHLKLTAVKIPLWTTTYRWDWGNDNIHNGALASSESFGNNAPLAKQSAPTDQEIQEEILFAKTSDREIVNYSESAGNMAWGGKMFLSSAPSKPDSAEGVTEAVLKAGFYDDTDIQVVDLGNGKYLATFIDLVPERESMDAFGAYYSVFDGSAWSVPQLLEDDGTADDVPTICNAGSKGYLIVWSDASRKLDENENVGDILNTYDLTGRFFNPETNELGDVMEITKTQGSDSVCDSAPEISYYEENGQEFMKLYYTKSEYEVTSEEEGEVIGDILNPYEVKAVRNYDFKNDTWATSYFGNAKEKLEKSLGDGYDAYVEKWYGQEFLVLAPTLEVKETLNDEGYWADNTTATVAETDLSQAMAKDSAVITYNHLSLQAYTLDKGGMAQEASDENLYLQIYNFHDDEYHHPILISGKNADISDLQFIRMPVKKADGTTEEATYLYWLEDSYVKRLNISSLVKNSLVKGATEAGQNYYYVDKSSSSVYEPEQIMEEPVIRVNEEGEETIERSITSFKVKQNGDYNYMLWTESIQQPLENEEDEQRIEQQLFAMRENTATGERTLPVQLTDKADQFIHRFDFVVTDNGELDVLAERMMLNEEGNPDQNTSELTALHIKPTDKLAISEISDASIAKNDDNQLAAQVDVTLENRNFNTQNNITISVQDAEGNVLSSEEMPDTEETDDMSDTDETANSLSMIGGQSLTIPAYLPMDYEGNYAGKIVLSVDGKEIETKELSGQLNPDLNVKYFTADISKRNEVVLNAKVQNTNYLPGGEAIASYGYIDADGNKVELGTQAIPPLELDETTDFTVTTAIDFDQFNSTFDENGSLVDTLEFYLDCDEFNSVTSTVSLIATASEYELMTGLKNVDAKPSLFKTNGDLETLETFQIGDKAYMNLWVGDDFAQNQPEYVNRTKLVWTESSDNVASVTRDGIITAIGNGTTTISGYIVPNDTESILYENGTSDTVDNYNIMPSAVIIPIKATINVSEANPDTTEPTYPNETIEPTSESNISDTTESTPESNESSNTTELTSESESATESVNPRDNYFADIDEICEMAKKDYAGKNDVTPANSTAFENADGTVTITMTDDIGSILDVYTIDPVTGKGTNQDGEEVNLPQTGTTSKVPAVTAGSTLIAFLLGAWAVIKSGVLRRKHDDV